MREKKEINIQIGSAIRDARERAGLTQEQFGELVSLGTKNVSDIERGVAGITVSTLKRICEKLSISSDSILGIVPISSPKITTRLGSFPPCSSAMDSISR